MTWIVTLDDPSICSTLIPNPNRTALSLNTGGLMIGGTSSGQGLDWGDATVAAYTSTQQWGEQVVDQRFASRTVTIPLILGADNSTDEETVRASLEAKVALFQREGGWLKRQRAGGLPTYADITWATLNVPDVWGETGGVEPGVVLTLTCLPDFYSDEVLTDVQTATGVFDAVLTQSSSPAVVAGHHPARCRIIISDTSGNNQLAMIWGLRSKHYDPAGTAALFYEAEAMTPLNGATIATAAGASGGGSNNVVELASLPAGSWVSMLTTTLVSGSAPLTHTGSYRVWIRATATANVQYQLLWGVGSLSVPAMNAPVTLPSSFGYWLLDLGEVRLDAPPVGTNEWFGAIQAFYPGTGAHATIDCVYLQPVDDGAGTLQYQSAAPASSVGTPNSLPTAATSVSGSGTVWANPTFVKADDSQFATTSTPAFTGADSQVLQATGYGLAVPTGATVQGIVVAMKRAAYLPSAQGPIQDASLYLLQGGSAVGSNHASSAFWPTAFDYITYGSPTDLWGTTWTYAQVNASNFGVAFGISFGDPNFENVAYVDAIWVQVFYTLASGFVVNQDAVVYASQTAQLTSQGHYREPSGSVYGPQANPLGDLPRLPAAGLEGRPCQLFVKPSRGDLSALPDAGLDALSVQVAYRPVVIGRQ